MRVVSKKTGVRFLVAMLAISAAPSAFAQQDQNTSRDDIVVNGAAQGPMTEGPEIKGVIAARSGDRVKIATADGATTTVAITEATRIKTGGGLFGGGNKLASNQLLNGLPITVKTMQSPGGGDLVASQISLKKNDLRTATMIQTGTSQRFDEQAAATEALRGRMGDIDKYNIKSTTNVHFDVGRADISAQDKAQLCSTANQATQTENALMLVVGYTDSTGGEDLNQALSEKRAAKVINYLQQACGWKPYRMLTPTGMATADPLASNDTPEGKAQNRRVAVNILVSKSVDGL
ncbi:outer membrane protein OmpA-like peptidoglycan-associated protein [Sphingomonas kyeonggiensis]|uniref:Outer membrane protein OmpA-like peptidoglycan-associated protein n=1 Tax=Sphingomonas kyeonggiensis TaxID=1268553 RepID=A0A7W7K1G1_9SPHN|nr:OmpA family protein [Sphingomonas kyeonggiensis]MBB4839272.1 outer membrane protein OmpA-like peptidoglycan-associated protein [Sphingomonas kyeonggiensis]